MDPIYVTGHRNPDTDSIVSAMAYAQLRNALGDREDVAARLGRVNDETQLVLDSFGFEPPLLIHNLRNQVSDLAFDTPPVLNHAVTVNHAWQTLHHDENTVALPVVDDEGRLFGMLTTNEVAANDMASLTAPVISDIPVFNLVSALEGQIILDGGVPTNQISGRVVVALPANGAPKPAGPRRYKLYDRIAGRVSLNAINLIITVTALLLIAVLIYGIATGSPQ